MEFALVFGGRCEVNVESPGGFYSAGTVRYFAKPLLSRGVEVYAASFANAVPVAEFALAQILLTNKGYFRLSQAYTAGRDAAQGCGNFGATVALLGAGEIGSALIERLRPFALRCKAAISSR